MKNILIIVILTLFTSCSTLKNIKDKESETKITELTEKSTDTLQKTDTNKAIKDDIAIPIPQGTSPEVTKELIDLVKRMQSSKSSGDNSYKFWYDEQLQQLRLRVEIAETQSRQIATESNTKKEKTFEENINEYVKKQVIPWWLYAIGFLFLWPYIKPIIMMILGPTNLVTGIKKIIDKKKND